MNILKISALFYFCSFINIQANALSHSAFNKASSFIGMHEKTHRNQIKSLIKVDPVRTPWCAAFVNGVLNRLGVSGSGSNKAISFAKYKSATKSPKKGDIVVFRSHVGFFQGFSGNRVAVLGGNQSNRIKVSYFNKNRVVSYRTI